MSSRIQTSAPEGLLTRSTDARILDSNRTRGQTSSAFHRPVRFLQTSEPAHRAARPRFSPKIPVKKTLTFAVSIQCPRRVVWETMFDPEGYKVWTAAFCAGSNFSGSWEQGQRILFLAPSGDGMTAVIAENRRYEHVSIRHLGEIAGGVEDTTSDKVKAWAPAYETYTLADSPGGTEVTVSVDVLPEFEQYMSDTFPKALTALKELCEHTAKGQ